MNVASYIYQSPSPSAVQVGRLDPSSVKEESKPKENAQKSEGNTSMQMRDETAMKAQNFQAAQTAEATPTSSLQNVLDMYA